MFNHTKCKVFSDRCDRIFATPCRQSTEVRHVNHRNLSDLFESNKFAWRRESSGVEFDKVVHRSYNNWIILLKVCRTMPEKQSSSTVIDYRL